MQGPLGVRGSAKKLKRKIWPFLIVLLLVGHVCSAFAAWPNDRPIEIIVGFAPGGPSDVLARAIAPRLAKELGSNVSVVIVNRPGAGGEIGVASLSRSEGDGYSIGVVNMPGYFVLPLYRKTAYDLKDLSLVARVVSDPQIMVVRKDSKWTDLRLIMEALKAETESLTAGNNGIGTSGHLAVMALRTSGVLSSITSRLTEALSRRRPSQAVRSTSRCWPPARFLTRIANPCLSEL
jgi:tripartite-type tricarboxylate transporter receptor subunit TctC